MCIGTPVIQLSWGTETGARGVGVFGSGARTTRSPHRIAVRSRSSNIWCDNMLVVSPTSLPWGLLLCEKSLYVKGIAELWGMAGNRVFF